MHAGTIENKIFSMLLIINKIRELKLYIFVSKKVRQPREIVMLLMGRDGTLTEGRIFVLPDGQEVKAYHVHDGPGIFLAKMAGLKVAIITGKTFPSLEKRAERLGIEELHEGGSGQEKSSSGDRRTS
jgi:3-deoxy-D-manno-octulosonate 8-phosphate phosphatase KdsC-like HAD superfamily phosphatase